MASSMYAYLADCLQKLLQFFSFFMLSPLQCDTAVSPIKKKSLLSTP